MFQISLQAYIISCILNFREIDLWFLGISDLYSHTDKDEIIKEY